MSAVDQQESAGAANLASVPALLREGYAVFDERLRLTACNARCAVLGGYPPRLLRPGTPYAELARVDAERDAAQGDPAAGAKDRVARLAAGKAFLRDERRSDGTVLSVSATPLSGG